MFEGFKQLKAFAERQNGEMLQPKRASELKVLVKLMEDNEAKALAVMEEWTISVGGRFKPGPLKTADRMVAKAKKDYGDNLRKILDGVRASSIFHCRRPTQSRATFASR